MIDWGAYQAGSRCLRCYIRRPDEYSEVDRIQDADQRVAAYIRDLEQEIADMQEYRKQLFRRTQTLYAAPYHYRVALKREHRYQCNVYYFLTVYKVTEDPSVEDVIVSNTKYAGQERRQAIADYNAYLKSHPGIDHAQDITRGKWER